MTERVTDGPAATAALATALAAELRDGDVVLLEGDLGAGKTTFAQALCAALGVRVPVSSPTFSVAHRYDTPAGPVAHLDLHRLGSVGLVDREMVDAELDDAWIGLVEWPSGAVGLEDRASWRVTLAHAGADRRTVEIGRIGGSGS